MDEEELSLVGARKAIRGIGAYTAFTGRIAVHASCVKRNVFVLVNRLELYLCKLALTAGQSAFFGTRCRSEEPDVAVGAFSRALWCAHRAPVWKVEIVCVEGGKITLDALVIYKYVALCTLKAASSITAEAVARQRTLDALGCD